MVDALHHMSGLDLFIAGFVLVVLIGGLGAVSNAILKDAGFGAVLNGVLLLTGAVLGAMLRAATIGF